MQGSHFEYNHTKRSPRNRQWLYIGTACSAICRHAKLVCMLQINLWQLVRLRRTLQRHSCEHLLAPHHAASVQHMSTLYVALVNSITPSITIVKMVILSGWMSPGSCCCKASLYLGADLPPVILKCCANCMITLPAAQTACRLCWDMALVQWCADVANHCRSRLQWGAADWPQEGRPDSKGGLLGGEVMLRLDLMPAFQVHLHNCCYHFNTVALQLSCSEQACNHVTSGVFRPS